jgi:hypothetical protein
VPMPGTPARSARLPKCTALCVGVGTFDEGIMAWEELPFASDPVITGTKSRAQQVAAALERFGFAPRILHDPNRDEINSELRRILADPTEVPELVIVHFVGHGMTDASGKLRFVDRSGKGLDIETIIVDAQQLYNGPRVVFLLDVCGAGTAASPAWSAELGDDRRVWALGACTSNATTERGNFSRAIAQALHNLADTDFPTTIEPIDFTLFFTTLIEAKEDAGCGRISKNFDIHQGDGRLIHKPYSPSPWSASEIHRL